MGLLYLLPAVLRYLYDSEFLCTQCLKLFFDLTLTETEHCTYFFIQKPHDRLTLRLLMSYIYGAHILDVSRSYTTTQHSR